MSEHTFPIELKCLELGNGKEEWWFSIDDERIGEVGVFTDGGKRPSEMFLVVLGKDLSAAGLLYRPEQEYIKGLY